MSYYGSPTPSHPAPSAPNSPLDGGYEWPGSVNNSLLDTPEGKIVRSGYVSVREDGSAWRRKWLVLRDYVIYFHRKENTPQASALLLADITKVDQTHLERYCLLIETKDRKLHLSLTSYSELYGWKDDIFARSPLSKPVKYHYGVHVDFDPNTGHPINFPEAWIRQLMPSAATREAYARNPRAVLGALGFYTGSPEPESEETSDGPSTSYDGIPKSS